jgi:hypothetical protein
MSAAPRAGSAHAVRSDGTPPLRMGGHGHLLVVRRRIGCDFVFGGKVAGQAPDFLCSVIVVKDKIPVVVLAGGTGRTYDCKRLFEHPAESQGVG